MYDIYFDLNNMHQVVDSGDDESWEDESIFDYDLIMHDEGPPTKKSYPNGCFCKVCKELFPFAEPNQPDGTLVCYSCRSFK